MRRLNPGTAATGRMPILYDPRIARGLIGSIVAAVNGAAIARGTSFLKDRMGQAILPESFTLTDNPLLPRRPGSRPDRWPR